MKLENTRTIQAHAILHEEARRVGSSVLRRTAVSFAFIVTQNAAITFFFPSFSFFLSSSGAWVITKPKLTTIQGIFINMCQLNSAMFAIQRCLTYLSLSVVTVTTARRELSFRAVLSAVTVTISATQAAVVYGCVNISTPPDPWGSGAVEIATRKVIPTGSVGLAQAHPLTKLPPMRKQPSAGLGPVTAHPVQSGVGPRIPNLFSTRRYRLSYRRACRPPYDGNNTNIL